MLNVWRSVSNEGPIQQYPLAVCAADSLKYPDDFVVFEIHYKDRIGENWFVRENSSNQMHNVASKARNSNPNGDGTQHKWYYYPQMMKNEALIFKQWDSEGRIQQGVAKKLLDKLNQEVENGNNAEMTSSVVQKTNSACRESISPNSFDGLSDFCIHTAFDDPLTDRSGNVFVPDRESIEVRCFALYD